MFDPAYPACGVFRLPAGVPVMRDGLQWAGGYEVDRTTACNIIERDQRTTILVPGGQSELLLHTAENMSARVVELEARHKGFVRLALATGAELVPAFNFGELQSMKNIELPTLQRFTRKHCGQVLDATSHRL